MKISTQRTLRPLLNILIVIGIIILILMAFVLYFKAKNYMEIWPRRMWAPWTVTYAVEEKNGTKHLFQRTYKCDAYYETRSSSGRVSTYFYFVKNRITSLDLSSNNGVLYIVTPNPCMYLMGKRIDPNSKNLNPLVFWTPDKIEFPEKFYSFLTPTSYKSKLSPVTSVVANITYGSSERVSSIDSRKWLRPYPYLAFDEELQPYAALFLGNSLRCKALLNDWFHTRIYGFSKMGIALYSHIDFDAECSTPLDENKLPIDKNFGVVIFQSKKSLLIPSIRQDLFSNRLLGLLTISIKKEKNYE